MKFAESREPQKVVFTTTGVTNSKSTKIFAFLLSRITMYLNKLFNIFPLVNPLNLLILLVFPNIQFTQVSNSQFSFVSIMNIMFSTSETRTKCGFFAFKYLGFYSGTPIIQRIGVSNIVKILLVTSFTDLKRKGGIYCKV